MTGFLEVQPTLENRWRAIILFGKNTATYKFALGEALLRLGRTSGDLVRLEELALPFADPICRHLHNAPKQTKNASSPFLDACRRRNAGEIGDDELREATVRDGFRYVLGAFHNLSAAEPAARFFVDERGTHKGIRLTDDFRQLAEAGAAADLGQEVEARWRLVETAWELGIGAPLVSHDPSDLTLGVERAGRRVCVTSSRDALNGYQKGHCFHCFAPVGVVAGDGLLAEVDHFFPHVLGPLIRESLDGIWNLVLACRECNRGRGGKSDRVPSVSLLERLHRRNEFLIGSDHPLRKTLIAQTGPTEADRISFLNRVHAEATRLRTTKLWHPVQRFEAAF